jgi:1-acyl-sn-glycerol-3-phosphate acyltransferase
MNFQDAIRAVRQWGPFIARTAGYGTFSIVAGPLTPAHSASTWAMRQWCKRSAQALEIDIQVGGTENVPTDTSFVYCSNHQSMLDILVLGAVLPGDFKWAAKRELMRIPFLGWHLRLAGHVPVDRGKGPKAVEKTVERFEKVLHEGKPLLIFPEGTRSATGVLKPFKTGGFVAAVRANKPVVPVALDGSWQLMDNGSVGSMRHVKVRVGRPIMPKTEGRESDRTEELRDRAYASVADLLRSVGGQVPEATPPSSSSAADDASSDAHA